ncbi:tubulin polymerization-promoting protein homolog [Armigeres subalbatus]|uniref:tubulin polymerization-promoting protein homolog n=1 Tax=Armigeres subalbatus TaxID=124917 RepID=UPI002ED158B3
MTAKITPIERPTLESMFTSYAKYRPTSNTFQGDGKRMLLSQSDAWMQQARLIGEKRFFTLTETAVTFFKFGKSSLDFEEYQKFLEMLCQTKGIGLEEVKSCMTGCGPPGMVS